MAERLSFCRSRIQSNSAELIRQFREEIPIAQIIRARSDFMDELLIGTWRALTAPIGDRLALLAVGGYGRRELHLHSDVDILILVTPDAEAADPEAYRTALSAFFSFLWDIGLKPGQSTRTVEETVELARRDQTVMTNLLEARLLHGPQALFDGLLKRLGPDQIWSSREFFAAKMEEQAARHAKYHDTAYTLEPNVKEGPGGLRDIQIIGWIIKRHYGSPDLRDLIIYGWLTEAEFAELTETRSFLWRVRFALHALTGRGEDRLLFDHQRELANQFGYHGEEPNGPVEQFMQRYFRAVMGLERLNEMVLQLFNEAVLRDDEDSVILPINDSFQAVNNYLEAIHPKVFQRNPRALLEVFLLLQQNPRLQGIRASTIRLIRQHLYLIDDHFRNDPKAARLFMDILRHPSGITHQLRRMNRYGVLAAYLPAFGKVVGRMQCDLFHVYTVDEHTLFVVRNLRRFALEKHRADHPHCNELFELVDRPELLYIAGLLHDIAKGSGGDHSEMGEQIAEEFCQRHAITGHDNRLVRWLVRYHLLMSMTAQRKDISDPQVIHEFAMKVGDPETLTHLYLLTVADIRATNPSLWNSWKGALLRELFAATRSAFRRGLEKPMDLEQRIRAVRDETLSLLERLGLGPDAIGRVWENLPDDYFLRYLPDEIAWHTIAIDATPADRLPLVLLRPMSQRGSAEVFIYAHDQDFIFAHSTALLDQLGLTVFDAKIITSSNGYVLNSYHVLESAGGPIKDHTRQVQICSKLRECLRNPSADPARVQRREPREIKHFTVQTQVYFHQDPQHRHTVLELLATDRPGLLSKVGQAFQQVGIRLNNAKISTIGSRAEDIFYVTGADDAPLDDPELREKLKAALIEWVGDI
ncbi:MAG: [protein-PII] uridylyltransferase [Methylococcaceae bacterium]|nr:[protein-PII] uridylyltransferase [Methylococcaceae bacterium]